MHIPYVNSVTPTRARGTYALSHIFHKARRGIFMNWVSVHDACPAEGDVVLVCDRHGAYFVATYFKGCWETVEMKRIEVCYWTEISPTPIPTEPIDELRPGDSPRHMKLAG